MVTDQAQAIPQIDDIAALDWFAVAAVKAREYHRDLYRAGVACFIPLETVWRSDRPKETYQRPLWLNWLFVFGDLQSCRMAPTPPLSIEPIHQRDPDRERLAELMELQRREVPIRRASPLMAGVEVEVIAGPLTGFKGRVVNPGEREITVHLTHYGAFSFPVEPGTLLSRGPQLIDRAKLEVIGVDVADVSAQRLRNGDGKRRGKTRAAERTIQ